MAFNVARADGFAPGLPRGREAFGVDVREGVLAYLDELGVLKPDVVAAHCVALTGKDIAIMAKRGVKAVHNPVSNMKLASGISPVVELLRAGVVVALGTDGPCSNNTADMFETMKFASLLQKVVLNDPTALPARTVLEMATVGGALALSWPEIGTIEPEKKADIIVIDVRKPHLTPLYSEESHLVYAVRSSDVRTVLVDGEPRISCLQLAAEAEGASITTIEGLAPEAIAAGDLESCELDPIQESFINKGAIQTTATDATIAPTPHQNGIRQPGIRHALTISGYGGSVASVKPAPSIPPPNRHSQCTSAKITGNSTAKPTKGKRRACRFTVSAPVSISGSKRSKSKRS